MVYLDYNASTPVDQRVLPAIVEAYSAFGNPSSAHHATGQAAGELVEEARSRVAALARRPEQDIILTSGASEAAVLGLVGAVLGSAKRSNIVVSPVEHKAILAASELAAQLRGGDVRQVRVDRNGVLDLGDLEKLVDESVAVVAVMAANNETGVVMPTVQASEIARSSGALMFVDATQLVGKGDIETVAACADLMVCSSHKIYGPKGAGVLVASRQVQRCLVPIVSGGGQERGLRGGTHNTPAIVGFGLAAEFAMKEQSSDTTRIGNLTDEFLAALECQVPDIELNGVRAERLSNTLNIRFRGADAEAVMASMPEIQVSAGSACQSAMPTPSHVLLAMGRSSLEAAESIRFSLGRPTTTDEIQTAAASVAMAVDRVRALTRA